MDDSHLEPPIAIAIAGASISGLTLAYALLADSPFAPPYPSDAPRRRFEIQVMEASPLKTTQPPTGVDLMEIHPRAMQMLLYLGRDMDNIAKIFTSQARGIDGKTIHCSIDLHLSILFIRCHPYRQSTVNIIYLLLLSPLGTSSHSSTPESSLYLRTIRVRPSCLLLRRIEGTKHIADHLE
jgi:hypothetical protein